MGVPDMGAPGKSAPGERGFCEARKLAGLGFRLGLQVFAGFLIDPLHR